jgi:heavy metal sensor kinase
MKNSDPAHSGFRYGSGLSMLPPMSLRNRIAFYYTATAAMLMALVFAAILFAIDRIVSLHYDQELRHEASEALQHARLDSQLFNELENLCELDSTRVSISETRLQPERISTDSGFVQLVDRYGRIVSKSVNLDGHTLAFNAGYSGVRYFDGNVGTEPVRQVQVPLINKKGKVEAWLIVAIPTGDIMRIFFDFKNIMFGSFPVIILFLFILARAIAGRSIRPVEEVIATAETLTQANLAQRIPLPRKQDELYRLSTTINALLDRLQEAFQREKHFTADASHELKTPLAVVKGTLDVLVRKPRAVEQYEEKIRYCLSELSRMAHLIEQLLLLARYEQESVRPNIVSIELTSVLDQVLSRTESLASGKQISFVRTNLSNARVAGDPAMLETILENIVTNAIKYSPVCSTVDIELSRNSDMLLCTITDHGIGIPEEKLPYVFDRFFRVDESRNSGTGGSGLGLSIVRKLADLQQISITITSQEEQGTSFRLLFSAG